MKFIEGCIRLVGPFRARKSLDSAGRHWLRVTRAFYISRRSKEVPCGDVRCDGGDKWVQSCCFLSRMFDPTCAMS